MEKIKKNLWSGICVLWALMVALFWFAMRVIWSGISKVLAEATGGSEPSAFLLELPLYISIFLWVLLALAVDVLFTGGIVSIGLGTLWAMVCNGRAIALFDRLFTKKITALAGLSK